MTQLAQARIFICGTPWATYSMVYYFDPPESPAAKDFLFQKFFHINRLNDQLRNIIRQRGLERDDPAQPRVRRPD